MHIACIAEYYNIHIARNANNRCCCLSICGLLIGLCCALCHFWFAWASNAAPKMLVDGVLKTFHWGIFPRITWAEAKRVSVTWGKQHSGSRVMANRNQNKCDVLRPTRIRYRTHPIWFRLHLRIISKSFRLLSKPNSHRLSTGNSRQILKLPRSVFYKNNNNHNNTQQQWQQYIARREQNKRKNEAGNYPVYLSVPPVTIESIIHGHDL